MLVGAQPAATGYYQPLPGLSPLFRGYTLEPRLAAQRAAGSPSEAAQREEMRLLRALARDSQALALARTRLQEKPDDVEAATVAIEYLILLGVYDEAARLTAGLNRGGLATPEEVAQALPIKVRRAFSRHVSPAAAATQPRL